MALKLSRTEQYVISVSLTLLACFASYLFIDIIGYRIVALILLLVVSISAILFDIFPVLLTALLSAIILNFLFIPPTFTFNIDSAEDILLFLMYFAIALINTVLTFKIRQFERKRRDEEEKGKTIELYNTLLNSLSHELRTPISTIIGAIDTIADQNTKLSEINKFELYKEIEIAGYRLNRQVENLLSMSRLEAGTIKPSYDWWDINEIVFTVLKENIADASDHTILFEPNDSLPLIKIDGGFLEMILHNLVHNAIQHTPKNTTIIIAVDWSTIELLISVSDNGPGFPKAQMDLVFDKFYKLNSTVTGGTGLGLSIVKGFTEALNGKIILRNLKCTGASFTVKIPVEISDIHYFDNE
ncbi:sensor protein KdpD [Arenibacter sp. NBRC 103722]|mgnify:CR=1 FL=1|uniref:sensor histidine kinase n=1 Tax=Arenibacter sp. NBRC 103722 TaxID=1113929 RepID=UPI0008535D46|nr:ATP-binding protein [Arenibacter sp. NBRC 103722]MDX1767954.1 ATP-binding protein [Arenibacter troitsensis]GBF22512.1 sensor protein KdpD [Arenibacter sp. NBRC 103722]